MKKKILTLIILISNLSFGQHYDGLDIEKSKIDKNNNIYTLGKEFIFEINITDNDKEYFLKENEANSFELTENQDSLKFSQIYITIIKPKLFQRTNKNQTEIIYSYEPKPTSVYSTGLVENKSNIWIHPPRAGFFESLETCPYPYIKLDKPVGYKWNDSMSIGNQWSNKMWGQWEGRLLLNYEYEIVGKENINTKFGKIDCIIVNAIANSDIGKSNLRAYFSKKYGFIKLDYTLFNGKKVFLTLNNIIDGPILRNTKEFIENKYE